MTDQPPATDEAETEAPSGPPSFEDLFGYLKPDERDHKAMRLWERLKAHVEANNGLGAELAQEYGVYIPPEVAARLRQTEQFDAMFEKLFPPGSKDRLLFEVKWQYKITDLLESERNRMQTPEATAERMAARGVVVAR